MADRYDTDVLAWSRLQAGLLRRIAAGERGNDQVDWPNTLAAAAHGHFRESMCEALDADLPTLYRRACLGAERHVLNEGPLVTGLPDQCPWTLDELLAAGTALQPPAP